MGHHSFTIDLFVADTCADLDCDFCVVDSYGTAKCACPAGKILSMYDGKTCKSKLTETKVVGDLLWFVVTHQ